MPSGIMFAIPSLDRTQFCCFAGEVALRAVMWNAMTEARWHFKPEVHIPPLEHHPSHPDGPTSPCWLVEYCDGFPNSSNRWKSLGYEMPSLDLKLKWRGDSTWLVNQIQHRKERGTGQQRRSGVTGSKFHHRKGIRKAHKICISLY